MGILDRIIKQEINGQSPARVAEEERWQQEMERQQYEQDMMAGGMSSIGQPLPQPKAFQLPPTFEKETMELYLKPRLPQDINSLTGHKRFWVYTNEASLTNTITSNDSGEGVGRKLASLRMALDFQGCDNCNNLIQDQMVLTNAEITMNKARSDFADGFRERVVPSVGVSMVGNYPDTRSNPERPHDSRMGWGLIGSKQR